MYNHFVGCTQNNGWVSETFNIQKGIRQGCPLSLLLFVISVEILAIKIIQESNIKGFKINIDAKTPTIKIVTVSRRYNALC